MPTHTWCTHTVLMLINLTKVNVSKTGPAVVQGVSLSDEGHRNFSLNGILSIHTRKALQDIKPSS